MAFHIFGFNRQHGVADKDTSVRKFLQREGEQFHMDAEVECLEKTRLFTDAVVFTS